MNTNEGKWILDQDSPLLDQIAVEMPNTYFHKKYMTLRDLTNEFEENGSLAHRVVMLEADIERLLEKLKDLKKGE